MSIRLTTLVVLLAFLGLPASSFGDPQPASEPGGGWILQSEFSDEFSGSMLDTNKWDNDVGDWREREWSWEPYNAYVEDGALHVRMQYEEHIRWPGGDTLYYKSGMIKSKDPNGIKYGYFEARIKAAPFYRGVCPAFWANRAERDPDGNYLGLWTEIVFCELTQHWEEVRLVCVGNIIHDHPDYPEADPEGKVVREWEYIDMAGLPDPDPDFDPQADFHIYGCEWDEDEIKWYIDGKLVRTRKNTCCPPEDDPGNPNYGLWHYPLDVNVSMGLRKPLTDEPSPEGFPTVSQVDYVRVWKPIVMVAIDIKPTSCPNRLNTKSKGVLPIAILGTEEFDVYDVDPETVTLEGVAPLRWAYEDVATPVGEADTCDCTEEGPDGYLDMTFKLDRQEVVAALGEVTDGEYRVLHLEGQTFEGTDIRGADCVWIKHKGKTPVPPPVISAGTFTGAPATIRLSLGEATDVSMVVYDVRGMRLRTVVNGTLASGDHEIRWDGRDEAGNAAANGVYFCRVKAGVAEETVKMLLMQ